MRKGPRRGGLIWGGLAVGAAYLGLPYLLSQRLGLGLVREGSWSRRFAALTFDDGPDPRTTPAVLDALQAAGVRATFFLIAPAAERWPELTRRIAQEGHEIGAHAVLHRHAWLRSPWSAWREPLESVRRLRELSGQPVRYHRPPHGGYTLSTLLGQRAAGVRAAHWSVMGYEWRPAVTPQRLISGVLARVRPGAVLVLHDAGPGGPTTAAALPTLLERLGARGYRLTPLSELPGAAPLGWSGVGVAGLPRRLAGLLDGVFDRLGGLRAAGNRADTLFRAGRTRFPLPLTLADGTVLRRGDAAAEYHVNNPLMVDIGLRRALRQAPDDLRALALDLTQDSHWQGVRAVYCLSALSPLLTILGFETHPLPASYRGRLGRWSRVLKWAYGTDVLHEPQAKLSVLSTAVFLARYGPQEQP